MSLPITFNAIYQERVWGGRKMESVYGRELPQNGLPYGESWEISDRADEQSVVADGKWKGMSLHELWCEKREEVFGVGLVGDRFPLLIKILDSESDLSIQVHPCSDNASKHGGDPKTEMWYIAGAEEGSKLYVGLREGATRESFEKALADGTVVDQVHAIEPEAGDSIFIESGRLHAIGAGFLIYEIQQNSDTTYRVFDWNRKGLDGKPRELHVAESMRCIDFNDFEPEMDKSAGDGTGCISDCPFFRVDQLVLSEGMAVENPDPERFSIVAVVSGVLEDAAGVSYKAGDFMIIPRGGDALKVVENVTLIQTVIP